MANKDKNTKKGVLMYYDILEQTKDLTDEQFGKLVKALIIYDKNEEVPKFDDTLLTFAFNMLKVTVDKNKAEYVKKCEDNRRKLQDYWNSQKSKDTKVYNSIPMYTNDTDTDIDIDNYNLNSSSNNNLPSSFNDNNISPSFQNSASSTSNPPLSQGKPDDIPPKGRKTIKNKSNETYILQLFEKIWVLYPRKVSKEQAKKTWVKKLINQKDTKAILEKSKLIATHLQKHITDWKLNKRKIEFIPHFSTWLNEEIPDKEV